MDFNAFAILAIFIAFTGVSVIRRVIRDRRAVFDENLTDEDRALVDQASFFLLLPISVALHELGHATLIWVFGGDVVGFGYFIFAGYVSYEAAFTDVQHIVVAVAGAAVNLVLAALAIGFVLLRRPPMRAAFNELLWQFAILSIANTLIFYPLLDFATGMNGDFRQMYFGGVPWLSLLIAVVHISVLAGGYLAFKNERFSAHVGTLTGLPPHVRRGFMGGFRLAKNAAAPSAVTPTREELVLRSALQRVASGWPETVQASIARRPVGPAALIRWRKADGDRMIIVAQEAAGSVVVVIPASHVTSLAEAISGSIWKRWAEFPGDDDMVLPIRLAMEEADRRSAVSLPATGG